MKDRNVLFWQSVFIVVCAVFIALLLLDGASFSETPEAQEVLEIPLQECPCSCEEVINCLEDCNEKLEGINELLKRRSGGM